MKAVKFDYHPDAMDQLCSAEEQAMKAAVEKVAALDCNAATYENTVLAIEGASTRFVNRTNHVLFLKHVSPEERVRAVADRWDTRIQQLFVDLFGRRDLYLRFKAVEHRGAPSEERDRRLLDEYMSGFRRNGLELPDDLRARYLEKKKKLVTIESEFSKTLLEWDDALELAPHELEGLPEAYVASLPKLPTGQYKITLDYPRYYSFMENASNEEARRKLEYKFHNRGGPKNLGLMEQALKIRAELAEMLGFATHATFVLERRMAKTPEAVTAFLQRLAERLKPEGERNLAELIELKRQDTGRNDVRIEAWDYRYYMNQLRKRKYEVDNEEIKQYFPLDHVLRSMLEMYERLFGVKFVKETEAPRWHESVECYRVQRNGETAAYFYTDLFPREAKYGHAAAFTLVSGYRKEDGTYETPVSAIVANFSPPASSKPSLLEHSEVETLFHEFGHIMHQVLTQASYGSFAGTSVKTDFVEAPSQMLENWVWNREALEKLSRHHLDAGKRLPDELVGKLVSAKLLGVGLQYLRQVAFATIDIAFHTVAPENSTELYARLMREIMLVPIQDGTHPQASFGHLMGGYDAGYYGYLWSKVYAQDMFTRFEKEGLLNPTTGADYRRKILEPGGERDPSALIESFLGRNPNEDAFLRSLGMSA